MNNQLLSNKRIAFIGGGAMAEAMISGLVGKQLLPSNQIIVSDPLAVRREFLAETFGIETTSHNQSAIHNADVVMLAVKPQYFAEAAKDLDVQLAVDSLVISIMAGVTIETMQKLLTHRQVVRSMPNTPAQIGQGMTVYTTSAEVSDEQKAVTQAVLSSCGEAVVVGAESYLDAATAVSGSGPGYMFLIMEAMIDAAVQLGFARPIAEKLVLQTMAGSAAYAQASDKHVAQLRNQVTSPAGTTAAGLHAMEKGNIRAVLAEGIFAAHKRSIELGKK